MITSKKYTIIDKPDNFLEINTELCILNFDTIANLNYVKKLISNNSNTVFWVTSNDFSKEFVTKMGKLGIQNIVEFPINIKKINDFFEKKADTNNLKTGYETLTDSNVLIVDDNDMNISLLQETLYDTGANLVCCNSSKDAINNIKEKKYDLLLLDILMPELSGFELAEYARNSKYNNNTPIIFISAVSGTENIINGYKLGACSYIEKPFSPIIIKAQIYNLLKKESMRKKEEKDKNHFVATLTHDLKGPINAEINALKYLIKNSSNKEDIVSDLLSSAKYMKHITDKILSHYKQENTVLELKKECSNLNKLILESIEELKYLTSDKNIKIRYNNISQNEPLLIDEIEIKRVLNNLIANAIEYSKENAFIDIILENNDKFYIVKIKDYGIGIDLKKHNKIFDDYITLSKEQKKIGFGLGLKISKAIIEAHGGIVAIDSSPNIGTNVCFTIPTISDN